MAIAPTIASAITTSAQTDDSNPSANPERISVAGPVCAAGAVSVGGPFSGGGKMDGGHSAATSQQSESGESNPKRREEDEAPAAGAGARVGNEKGVYNEESDDGCDRENHVAVVDGAHRIAHGGARRHWHRHDAENR